MTTVGAAPAEVGAVFFDLAEWSRDGDVEFARMACVKKPFNLPACDPPRCSNGSPDRRSALGSCASG